MGYNYPDLSFSDLKDAYLEADHNVKKQAAKVGNWANVVPENIRYRDVIEYAERVDHLDFYPRHFEDEKLKHRFAGSILIGFDDTNQKYGVVGYNADVTPGRQNSSKLHEWNHFHYDASYVKPGESFSDIIGTGTYSPSEQYREAVASFGAAFLQIPENPLISGLLAGRSIEQPFSRQFESSYANNFTRVRDFLIFKHDFSPLFANKLTSDYIDGGRFSQLSQWIEKNFSINDYPQELYLDGDHSSRWDFEDDFDI